MRRLFPTLRLWEALFVLVLLGAGLGALSWAWDYQSMRSDKCVRDVGKSGSEAGTASWDHYPFGKRCTYADGAAEEVGSDPDFLFTSGWLATAFAVIALTLWKGKPWRRPANDLSRALISTMTALLVAPVIVGTIAALL